MKYYYLEQVAFDYVPEVINNELRRNAHNNAEFVQALPLFLTANQGKENGLDMVHSFNLLFKATR